MIDLYSGRITDLLTAVDFLADPEIQAVAYAILQEKRRIIDYANKTRTISMIDNLPEDLLDILAIDYNIGWWDENWPVERKRQSLKDSWRIHRLLGTPEAVNMAVQAAFGAGRVEEWFEYSGSPYHFRVVGLSPEMAQSGYSAFLRLLAIVKRLSSHLDAVVMESQHNQLLYSGCGVFRCNRVTIDCGTLPAEVTYLVDENGDILADENNSRYIDDEEEQTE